MYDQSNPKTWPLRDQAIRRAALEEAAKLLDPENFPLTDGYRIMASTLAERAAAIRALAEPHPKQSR